MICSEFRTAKNRRNAERSSRPGAEAGEDPSRAKALLEALWAPTVVAEDAALVQKRAEDFFYALRPQNHLHCWLVSQISTVSLRIDRCVRTERRIRDKISIKAELLWEGDRKLEATLLGEQLGNRPEVVVEQLGRTVHGCEWLMGRWAMLAHAADVNKGWSPAQAQLAFDLLGTPPEFRDGTKPGASLDIDGQVLEGPDDPAAVARREIAILKDRRDLMEGLDEANRALAQADLNEDGDPELARLRRQESTLHGRLRWFLGQLRHQSPHHEPLRGLMTSWLGQHEPPPSKASAPPPPIPTPAPKAEKSWIEPISPPFDLLPEECPPLGEKVDFPKILAARQQKKLKKAEARRESRRRKIDKLRA